MRCTAVLHQLPWGPLLLDSLFDPKSLVVGLFSPNGLFVPSRSAQPDVLNLDAVASGMDPSDGDISGVGVWQLEAFTF